MQCNAALAGPLRPPARGPERTFQRAREGPGASDVGDGQGHGSSAVLRDTDGPRSRNLPGQQQGSPRPYTGNPQQLRAAGLTARNVLTSRRADPAATLRRPPAQVL